MIKSTRIRVGRNLAKFPLGPGVKDKAQRGEIEKFITTALAKFDGDLKGKYFSLDSLSEKDRK
jgi:protein-arginine kinase